MLRLKRLAVLNIVAICVITGFFAWVMHLPAPDTHSGQTLSAPAQAAPAAPAQAARTQSAGQTGAPGVTIAGPEYSEPAAGGQQALGLELLPADSTHAVSTTDFTIDAGWLARTAAQTGIPARALQAYVAAAGAANVATPGCGIGWNTLAAIGWIESGHGTHGGGELTPAGQASQPIIGPSLNGDGFASIPDTDAGVLDGDTAWDHAVGPMQFIPSTWRLAGRDGSGDGVADPLNIDDAALSAAFYLCAADRDLTAARGWTDAVYSYNQSDAYITQVLDQANSYAALSGAAG
ncbi:murein transglycosylase [Arthrobacter sp. Soil736]|uniref:lytic transglycosylase domain-containing protein n=1 Tax=Arthrobacter sp. Soil736 TaxID=1736395 RepID=UPI0006FF6B30|nr:lytic transglycosylase domain-containing protein [Arthrobacter sp. Soil736]KRE54823.1 murein transglycosylase [Arthrobacter sp. Soil736]